MTNQTHDAVVRSKAIAFAFDFVLFHAGAADEFVRP
jgi:hypothetical protein